MVYIFSVVLLMLHMGVLDARMENNKFPAWLRDDVIYLGGTLFVLLMVAFSAHYYAGNNFICTTFGAIFIGSVGWDIVFGIIKYGDAFYPYKKWFENFGFKNKAQRILFDMGRLVIAIIFLIIR